MRVPVVALLLSLALGGCASRSPAVWKADEIERIPNYSVNLNRQDGTVAGRISKDSLARITEVQQKLEQVAGPIRADLYVADGDTPNAFASVIQGRMVIAINLGMISMLGYDKDAIAAVLGHELAHLYLDHLAESKEREDVRQAVSIIGGIALGVLGVPMGGTIADLSTQAVARTYDRDQEREADQKGFEYMVAAGFDPEGAVVLWTKMKEKAGSGGIPFLSTHPMSDERIQNMKTMIAALPSTGGGRGGDATSGRTLATTPVEGKTASLASPSITLSARTRWERLGLDAVNSSDPIGARITRVGAELEGKLQAGDVITSIQAFRSSGEPDISRAVTGSDSLRAVIDDLDSGKGIVISFVRNGSPSVVGVPSRTLGKK